MASLLQGNYALPEYPSLAMKDCQLDMRNKPSSTLLSGLQSTDKKIGTISSAIGHKSIWPGEQTLRMTWLAFESALPVVPIDRLGTLFEFHF